MAISGQDVKTTVEEIQAAGDMILSSIETLAPGVAVPAGIAQMLLDLASKAVGAWAAASDTPITIEALQALLPNPVPLTPPTE